MSQCRSFLFSAVSERYRISGILQLSCDTEMRIIMDFNEIYKQKLTSADEAVKVIKSGDWVDYGWCTGTPDALDKALAKRTDELKDVNLRGGILLKPLAVFEREDAGEHFTWNSWHMSGIERKYINRGFSTTLQSVIPSFQDTIVTPLLRMM